MVGFRATVDDPTIRVGDELEDALVRGRELVTAIGADEVRLPPPISVSRRLIEDWLVQTLAQRLWSDFRRVIRADRCAPA